MGTVTDDIYDDDSWLDEESQALDDAVLFDAYVL